MDTMDTKETPRVLPFVSLVSLVVTRRHYPVLKRPGNVVTAIVCGMWLLGAAPAIVHAHSGPPFPIFSERAVGPYSVAVWADPDTTDDGSAAGQFWVLLQPADRSIALPAETRAEVSVAA